LQKFPKKQIKIKRQKSSPVHVESNSGQTSIYLLMLKKLFWNKRFLYILLFLFLLFIPWVPVLYTGVLIYFPYDETGKERYTRITGPLIQYIGGEWVSSDRIPQACKKAIVIAEDSDFYNHSGISIESIRSSFEYNRKQGRIISGASTISQQFIKNAFLNRKKTYIRKIREALGAILFNLLFSKDQQLTWYLNVVEFGPRVYGLQAASNYYFKKDASRLNIRECATLATFLPRPVLFSRGYKSGHTPIAFQRRFQRIYSGLAPAPIKREKEKEKEKEEVIEDQEEVD
jgi:monofunctional biosynthetic peptidoglycan transglycosylase